MAIDLLGRFNAGLAWICVWLASALIGMMTIAVIAGVYFRYIVNDSIGWTEEVAILSAIWVAFLVAPYAYRTGGHVSIDMLPSLLPEAAARVLKIALHLMVLWLLWRFFWEALTYTQRGAFVRANTLPVQLSWFRSILPASIVMMALVGVELILREAAVLVTGDRRHDPARLMPQGRAE
jgi:TRAP-type C4-dicarboxylate transport system permease small subunit